MHTAGCPAIILAACRLHAGVGRCRGGKGVSLQTEHDADGLDVTPLRRQAYIHNTAGDTNQTQQEAAALQLEIPSYQ